MTRDINNHQWSIVCNELVKYCGNEKNVIIPEGVKEIKSGAFIGSGLNSVLIPNSVISIGTAAFAGNNLTKIELNSNISYIGPLAFSDNNLTQMIIHSVSLKIEREAFSYNPLRIIRLTRETKYLECVGEEMNTVNLLELSNYETHSIFCSLCPNLEELYIDNISGTSLFEFLKKCHLEEKKNLKRIFIKNKISWIKKKVLQTYYPNITFGYDPMTVFSSETKSNVLKNEGYTEDLEVQERIEKIYQTISLLNEKEKILIEKDVALLIEEYKMSIEELKPKFEIENEISMSFQITQSMDVHTLRKKFLHNLDTINVNLAVSSNLNKLMKEIAEYKNCIQTKITMTPNEITTVKDKVQFILYSYQNLENDSIKKELNELLDQFQKRISEEIVQMFQDRIILTSELDVTTEFEKKIAELYEKTKDYQTKVNAYLELLDSLELKNDSELAIEIRTAKEILNIFYISDKNKIYEDLENVITKYKSKIRENVSFENIKNLEDAIQIEWNIRSDLQPILVEIYNLSPKVVCFYKLKEELNGSLKSFSNTEKEDAKGAIFDIVKEIKDVVNQGFISAEIRSKVQNLVENCLQGWLKELTTNEYKILETSPIKEVGINLSDNLHFEILVLKELLSIKTSLQSYIKKSTEYQKVSNSIFNLNKSFSFEDINQDDDTPLINTEGLPVEEFDLENYKNYMKNKYDAILDENITEEQWNREVEQLEEEFLNKIIYDTKEFILCILKNKHTFVSDWVYVNVKIKNELCFVKSDNLEMCNPFDKCFQPLEFNKGKDLVVSKYLVSIFFQRFILEQNIYSISINLNGPKEVWDILCENNCSQQAVRRRIKEIHKRIEPD